MRTRRHAHKAAAGWRLGAALLRLAEATRAGYGRCFSSSCFPPGVPRGRDEQFVNPYAAYYGVRPHCSSNDVPLDLAQMELAKRTELDPEPPELGREEVGGTRAAEERDLALADPEVLFLV